MDGCYGFKGFQGLPGAKSRKKGSSLSGGSIPSTKLFVWALALISVPTVVFSADVPFGPQQVLSTTAGSANQVRAVDLDGDGDLDVVSAARRGETQEWYENLGGVPPSFTTHSYADTPGGGPGSVHARDLDGDGDIDLVLAFWDIGVNDQTSKITWYKNDGIMPPSFTEHNISNDELQAASVFAGDVNGDGDMDVISASFNGQEIAWYESDGMDSPSFRVCA